MTRALVVGAGIAGLATAAGLGHRGIGVDLIERAPRWEVLGSGITLSGQALRALALLGLDEECVAAGFGITEFDTVDVDGSPARSTRLPTPNGPGRPAMLGIMRTELHRILLDHAVRGGVDLRPGITPVGIETEGGRCRVELSTGERAVYDLVVGADGVHSSVRGMVFDPIEPEFRGQGTFRTITARPDGMRSFVQFRSEGGTDIGFTPVSEGLMYMYCNLTTAQRYHPHPDELVDQVRARIAPFGGLVAEVRDLITDPAQVNYTNFDTIVVPAPWNRGRVVLVGDAAHTTTPHLGMGGAMCLEDAVVLGEELDAADDIDVALAAYSARRYPRCADIVATAVQLSYWQTHPATPGADHEGLITAGFRRFAEPF